MKLGGRNKPYLEKKSPNRKKGKIASSANEFYMEIHLTKHEHSMVKRILKGKKKGRNSVGVYLFI